MKKHILLLGLCLSLSLSAKSVSDYKVGEELSDKEGVEYFKELSKRPVVGGKIKCNHRKIK